jgi:ABC-2 type transport system ATP-binding protein
VGPNGAGKITTLKIPDGSDPPGARRRLHPGPRRARRASAATSASRRRIRSRFTDRREILAFYARLSGVPRSRLPARVATLLDWVGLTAAADSRLRTYSKGMLQRIGIAQALVHDPSVVFLDEPMSGLDPIGRKEVRDLILRLRAAGKTVFMSTHILSDVEMVCDRVAIIVRADPV